MMEYLPNSRKYLREYFSHNYDDIHAASLELRPRNGYGHFYRSEEVYNLLFNIHAHVQDSLLSTHIPQSYPSPKALIDFIRNFVTYLKSHDELFADIYENRKKNGGHVSTVVQNTDEIRINLIEVLSHILNMDEVKNIEVGSNDDKTDLTTKQNKNQKGHNIENKQPSKLESVLAAYDLEEIKIFEWLSILKGKQLLALLAFITAIFFAGYNAGSHFEKNKSILESIDYKRTIHIYQDTLNQLRFNTTAVDSTLNPER